MTLGWVENGFPFRALSLCAQFALQGPHRLIKESLPQGKAGSVVEPRLAEDKCRFESHRFDRCFSIQLLCGEGGDSGLAQQTHK